MIMNQDKKKKIRNRKNLLRSFDQSILKWLTQSKWVKKTWGKNIKKNDGSQRNAKSKGGGLELKNLSIIESRVYFRNVKDELDIQVSGK